MEQKNEPSVDNLDGKCICKDDSIRQCLVKLDQLENLLHTCNFYGIINEYISGTNNGMVIFVDLSDIS